MRKKILMLFIMCIGFSLIACENNKVNQHNNTKLKVGAILGLSGAGAFYSQDVRDGMLLAQDNLGKNIEIIFEDSKTNPGEAVKAFNKLVNMDQVDVAISLFGGVSAPLAPLANITKTPLMVSICSTEDIGKNSFVLQYYLKAEDYAYPIAEVVKQQYLKVAIVYVQDDFGESVKNFFTEKFSQNNNQTIIEGFKISEMDYKINLTKIKDSDAEAIVFAGFKPHYINIMQNIKELGLNLPVFEISANTMYPSIIQEMNNTAEGNIAIALDFPVSGGYTEFKTSFKNKFNRQANVAASLGHDMINIIAQAAQGKKMSGEELRDKIIALKEFSGLNGLTKINNYGEFIFPTHVIQVKNGQIVKYEE